jgi:hypothetical protein
LAGLFFAVTRTKKSRGDGEVEISLFLPRSGAGIFPELKFGAKSIPNPLGPLFSPKRPRGEKRENPPETPRGTGNLYSKQIEVFLEQKKYTTH